MQWPIRSRHGSGPGPLVQGLTLLAASSKAVAVLTLAFAPTLHVTMYRSRSPQGS